MKRTRPYPVLVKKEWKCISGREKIKATGSLNQRVWELLKSATEKPTPPALTEKREVKPAEAEKLMDR